ncbi:hypothetical protein EWM64_g771 [Hericium alpestre]|uniref:ADF-H domain-containing protein n=1 Tax=Hericium alpestre TaxID=135208 RepID=A0A4Z0AA90_9AGAM|nr:hypothetical protein EWM64_g771 [Hericium alpestre]
MVDTRSFVTMSTISCHRQTVELLVLDSTVPVEGTFESDLAKLQDLLEDTVPASVLVRLEEPPTEWLAIHYVPDSAKIRDKMLYASTRTTLTKNLPSTHFSDTLFATSKEDLTPAAYAAHRRSVAAPQPMTAREKEMEELKAAERKGGGAYAGNRARINHVGQAVGYVWPPEVEDAIKELASGSDDRLAIVTLDPASETLNLMSVEESSADELGSKIPSSEPVFIYSCPSSSPVKHRMMYASGTTSVHRYAKSILPPNALAERKIETSDPKELDAAHLQVELALSPDPSRVASPAAPAEENRGFARPRGPAKRR